MRVTKRTSIAMRLLMYCATHPERLVTKSEVAECCDVSENHLAQVINQLGRIGYLDTQRGRNGGIRLGRAPSAISIGQVFRDVEGCPDVNHCVADSDCSCRFVGACALRNVLADASQAFYSHLDHFSLADIMRDNSAMALMLQPMREVA
ncbi:RrF2 family transcriptional regulator [Seohaeicola zhoushanensis]|uniref:Rrf2 family transcriptional regulator n=1 Tax=Seohaeicola zhoushanensis TaxID=1569283 RepID=A0A8J3M6Z8_9RHOB|nr:Rrf2 family transcriptional regulator [Seohaeicola zhoushanensis]GHF43564.1 Rrf2 family transcriptional regulator [Seohaeicola zhoushanensis]